MFFGLIISRYQCTFLHKQKSDKTISFDETIWLISTLWNNTSNYIDWWTGKFTIQRYTYFVQQYMMTSLLILFDKLTIESGQAFYWKIFSFLQKFFSRARSRYQFPSINFFKKLCNLNCNLFFFFLFEFSTDMQLKWLEF